MMSLKEFSEALAEIFEKFVYADLFPRLQQLTEVSDQEVYNWSIVACFGDLFKRVGKLRIKILKLDKNEEIKVKDAYIFENPSLEKILYHLSAFRRSLYRKSSKEILQLLRNVGLPEKEGRFEKLVRFFKEKM